MAYFAAILLGLGIVTAQVAHGAFNLPALAIPAYALAGMAGMVSGSALFRRQHGPPFHLTALVFATAAWVIWRALHSADPELAAIDIAAVSACAAAWGTLATGAASDRSRLVFLGIVVAGALAQALIGVVQFGSSAERPSLPWFSIELQQLYAGRFGSRARGTYLNPNHFVWLMNAASLICLALAAFGRMKMVLRIFLFYCAGALAVLVVLSASRGGIISFALAGSAMLLAGGIGIWTALGRRRLILSFSMLALAVVFGAGVYIAFNATWLAQARFDSLLLPDLRASLNEHALRLFEVFPLTGGGSGSFGYAARLFRVGNQPMDATHVHNDWIQFLAEHGLCGLAWLVLLVAGCLWNGLASFLRLMRAAALEEEERPLSNPLAICLGAFAAVVAFAVQSFVDFNMHLPANALLASALLGILSNPRSFVSPGRGRAEADPVRNTVATLVAVAAGGILAFYCWRNAVPEFRLVQGKNAARRGETQRSLEAFAAGLGKAPEHSGLLSAMADALCAYDSVAALQLACGAASMEQLNSARNGEPREQRKAILREAAALLERAVQRRPQERAYRWQLARVAAELGQSDEARAQLLESIRLDPMHGLSYARYGEYLEEIGNKKRALDMYWLGANLPGGSYAQIGVESLSAEIKRPIEEE